MGAGLKPGLQVEGALAPGVLFPRGALEGVLAPGGKVDGAFAQGHGLFDGDDLQAGDRGEARFFVEARAGGFGDHGFGRFGQGQEHADPGLFPLDHALEVAGRRERIEQFKSRATATSPRDTSSDNRAWQKNQR